MLEVLSRASSLLQGSRSFCRSELAREDALTHTTLIGNFPLTHFRQ